MDKDASAFIASKYVMKRPVDEFERYQDVLSYTKNYIIKVFKDLIEYQYALATKNGVLNINRSDILDINSGGSIIPLTRETLTISKVRGWRLFLLVGNTRSCKRTMMVGCYWNSILSYFRLSWTA